MHTACSIRQRDRRATVSKLLGIAVLLLSASPGTGSATPASPSPETEVTTGVFLVASRNLTDPRFRETVVLVTGHSAQGTVGLILNRPTGRSLAEAFPKSPSLEGNNDPVHIGGPVGAETIQLLVRSGTRPDDSRAVLDTVYVSSSGKLLERLGQLEGNDGEAFRVFAGYSGWAPGQLDNEILRGDWHVMPGDAPVIFMWDAGEIWPELIHRIAPLHRLEARLAPAAQSPEPSARAARISFFDGSRSVRESSTIRLHAASPSSSFMRSGSPVK